MLTTRDGDILVTFLAKLANLSRSGVRFLEKQGVLKPAYNESGYRVYPFEDFIRLKEFQNLRAMGFSQKESLMVGAMGPGERADALRRKREELNDEYERRLCLMEAALEQAERVAEPIAASVVDRPAFLALPDLATFVDSARIEDDAENDRSPIEMQGIRWWNDLPDVSFGAIVHDAGDGTFRVGRYALVEAGACDASAFACDEGVVSLPSRRCLHVCGEDYAPGVDPKIPHVVADLATRLGVEVLLDETILRSTYISFDTEKTTIVPEMWYPVA